jgi:hypothetical protein
MAESTAAGQGDLMDELPVPGMAGITGPFPYQYSGAHVYARDIHSIPGLCVCGAPLASRRHPYAAPGVPVPARLRRGTEEAER